jgi:hypothetical protein
MFPKALDVMLIGGHARCVPGLRLGRANPRFFWPSRPQLRRSGCSDTCCKSGERPRSFISLGNAVSLERLNRPARSTPWGKTGHASSWKWPVLHVLQYDTACQGLEAPCSQRSAATSPCVRSARREKAHTQYREGSLSEDASRAHTRLDGRFSVERSSQCCHCQFVPLFVHGIVRMDRPAARARASIVMRLALGRIEHE